MPPKLVLRNDVLDGISDKAMSLWHAAIRRATQGRQMASQGMMAVIFQVGYMLGIDGGLIGDQLHLTEDLAHQEVTQGRFMELCIKLVKLHNELVHLQLPQLAEKRLSVSQALRQAFEEYSGQLAPAGSDAVLGQLGEAQLLRICQDAGCMEPQGSLSQSGLKNVLAAFRPQAYEGPLAVDYPTFCKVLAAIASEIMVDLYTPVAALGLAVRPLPLLREQLSVQLDLDCHWQPPTAFEECWTLKLEPPHKTTKRDNQTSAGRGAGPPSNSKKTVSKGTDGQDDSEESDDVDRLVFTGDLDDNGYHAAADNNPFLHQRVGRKAPTLKIPDDTEPRDAAPEARAKPRPVKAKEGLPSPGSSSASPTSPAFVGYQGPTLGADASSPPAQRTAHTSSPERTSAPKSRLAPLAVKQGRVSRAGGSSQAQVKLEVPLDVGPAVATTGKDMPELETATYKAKQSKDYSDRPDPLPPPASLKSRLPSWTDRRGESRGPPASLAPSIALTSLAGAPGLEGERSSGPSQPIAWKPAEERGMAGPGGLNAAGGWLLAPKITALEGQLASLWERIEQVAAEVVSNKQWAADNHEQFRDALGVCSKEQKSFDARLAAFQEQLAKLLQQDKTLDTFLGPDEPEEPDDEFKGVLLSPDAKVGSAGGVDVQAGSEPRKSPTSRRQQLQQQIVDMAMRRMRGELRPQMLAELEEFRSGVAAAVAEASAAKGAAARASGRAFQMSEQVQQLSKSGTQLQASLQEAQVQLDGLDTDLRRQLQARATALSDLATSSKAALKDLKDQLDAGLAAAQQHRAEVRSELAELQAAQQQQEAGAAQLGKEVVDAKAGVERQGRLLAGVQDQVQLLQVMETQHGVEVEAVQQQVRVLLTQVTTAQQQVQEVQTQQAAAQQQVQTLAQQQAEVQQQVLNVQSQQAVVQQQQLEQQATLLQQQQRLVQVVEGELRQEVAAVQGSLQALQGVVQQQSQVGQEARAEVEKEVRDLTAQVQAGLAVQTTQQQQTAILQSQLLALQANLAQTIGQAGGREEEEHEQELQGVKAQLQDAVTALASMQQREEAVAVQLQGLSAAQAEQQQQAQDVLQRVEAAEAAQVAQQQAGAALTSQLHTQVLPQLHDLSAAQEAQAAASAKHATAIAAMQEQLAEVSGAEAARGAWEEGVLAQLASLQAVKDSVTHASPDDDDVRGSREALQALQAAVEAAQASQQQLSSTVQQQVQQLDNSFRQQVQQLDSSLQQQVQAVQTTHQAATLDMQSQLAALAAEQSTLQQRQTKVEQALAAVSAAQASLSSQGQEAAARLKAESESQVQRELQRQQELQGQVQAQVQVAVAALEQQFAAEQQAAVAQLEAVVSAQVAAQQQQQEEGVRAQMQAAVAAIATRQQQQEQEEQLGVKILESVTKQVADFQQQQQQQQAVGAQIQAAIMEQTVQQLEQQQQAVAIQIQAALAEQAVQHKQQILAMVAAQVAQQQLEQQQADAKVQASPPDEALAAQVQALAAALSAQQQREQELRAEMAAVKASQQEQEALRTEVAAAKEHVASAMQLKEVKELKEREQQQQQQQQEALQAQLQVVLARLDRQEALLAENEQARRLAQQAALESASAKQQEEQQQQAAVAKQRAEQDTVAGQHEAEREAMMVAVRQQVEEQMAQKLAAAEALVAQLRVRCSQLESQVEAQGEGISSQAATIIGLHKALQQRFDALEDALASRKAEDLEAPATPPPGLSPALEQRLAQLELAAVNAQSLTMTTGLPPALLNFLQQALGPSVVTPASSPKVEGSGAEDGFGGAASPAPRTLGALMSYLQAKEQQLGAGQPSAVQFEPLPTVFAPSGAGQGLGVASKADARQESQPQLHQPALVANTGSTSTGKSSPEIDYLAPFRNLQLLGLSSVGVAQEGHIGGVSQQGVSNPGLSSSGMEGQSQSMGKQLSRLLPQPRGWPGAGQPRGDGRGSSEDGRQGAVGPVGGIWPASVTELPGQAGAAGGLREGAGTAGVGGAARSSSTDPHANPTTTTTATSAAALAAADAGDSSPAPTVALLNSQGEGGEVSALPNLQQVQAIVEHSVAAAAATCGVQSVESVAVAARMGMALTDYNTLVAASGQAAGGLATVSQEVSDQAGGSVATVTPSNGASGGEASSGGAGAAPAAAGASEPGPGSAAAATAGPRVAQGPASLKPAHIATSPAHQLASLALASPTWTEALAAARLALSLFGPSQQAAGTLAALLLPAHSFRGSAGPPPSLRWPWQDAAGADPSPAGAQLATASRALTAAAADSIAQAAHEARQVLQRKPLSPAEDVKSALSRVENAMWSQADVMSAVVAEVERSAAQGLGSALHLARGLLLPSATCNPTQAREAAQLAARIWGPGSAEAELGRVVASLPGSSLSASNQDDIARELAAAVSQHGVYSPPAAVLRARLALTSSGPDSPEAAVAIAAALAASKAEAASTAGAGSSGYDTATPSLPQLPALVATLERTQAPTPGTMDAVLVHAAAARKAAEEMGVDSPAAAAAGVMLLSTAVTAGEPSVAQVAARLATSVFGPAAKVAAATCAVTALPRSFFDAATAASAAEHSALTRETKGTEVAALEVAALDARSALLSYASFGEERAKCLQRFISAAIQAAGDAVQPAVVDAAVASVSGFGTGTHAGLGCAEAVSKAMFGPTNSEEVQQQQQQGLPNSSPADQLAMVFGAQSPEAILGRLLASLPPASNLLHAQQALAALQQQHGMASAEAMAAAARVAGLQHGSGSSEAVAATQAVLPLALSAAMAASPPSPWQAVGQGKRAAGTHPPATTSPLGAFPPGSEALTLTAAAAADAAAARAAATEAAVTASMVGAVFGAASPLAAPASVMASLPHAADAASALLVQRAMEAEHGQNSPQALAAAARHAVMQFGAQSLEAQEAVQKAAAASLAAPSEAALSASLRHVVVGVDGEISAAETRTGAEDGKEAASAAKVRGAVAFSLEPSEADTLDSALSPPLLRASRSCSLAHSDNRPSPISVPTEPLPSTNALHSGTSSSSTVQFATPQQLSTCGSLRRVPTLSRMPRAKSFAFNTAKSMRRTATLARGIRTVSSGSPKGESRSTSAGEVPEIGSLHHSVLDILTKEDSEDEHVDEDDGDDEDTYPLTPIHEVANSAPNDNGNVNSAYRMPRSRTLVRPSGSSRPWSGFRSRGVQRPMSALRSPVSLQQPQQSQQECEPAHLVLQQQAAAQSELDAVMAGLPLDMKILATTLDRVLEKSKTGEQVFRAELEHLALVVKDQGEAQQRNDNYMGRVELALLRMAQQVDTLRNQLRNALNDLDMQAEVRSHTRVVLPIGATTRVQRTGPETDADAAQVTLPTHPNVEAEVVFEQMMAAGASAAAEQIAADSSQQQQQVGSVSPLEQLSNNASAAIRCGTQDESGSIAAGTQRVAAATQVMTGRPALPETPACRISSSEALDCTPQSQHSASEPLQPGSVRRPPAKQDSYHSSAGGASSLGTLSRTHTVSTAYMDPPSPLGDDTGMETIASPLMLRRNSRPSRSQSGAHSPIGGAVYGVHSQEHSGLTPPREHTSSFRGRMSDAGSFAGGHVLTARPNLPPDDTAVQQLTVNSQVFEDRPSNGVSPRNLALSRRLENSCSSISAQLSAVKASLQTPSSRHHPHDSPPHGGRLSESGLSSRSMVGSPMQTHTLAAPPSRPASRLSPSRPLRSFATFSGEAGAAAEAAAAAAASTTTTFQPTSTAGFLPAVSRPNPVLHAQHLSTAAQRAPSQRMPSALHHSPGPSSALPSHPTASPSPPPPNSPISSLPDASRVAAKQVKSRLAGTSSQISPQAAAAAAAAAGATAGQPHSPQALHATFPLGPPMHPSPQLPQPHPIVGHGPGQALSQPHPPAQLVKPQPPRTAAPSKATAGGPLGAAHTLQIQPSVMSTRAQQEAAKLTRKL